MYMGPKFIITCVHAAYLAYLTTHFELQTSYKAECQDKCIPRHGKKVATTDRGLLQAILNSALSSRTDSYVFFFFSFFYVSPSVSSSSSAISVLPLLLLPFCFFFFHFSRFSASSFLLYGTSARFQARASPISFPQPANRWLKIYLAAPTLYR